MDKKALRRLIVVLSIAFPINVIIYFAVIIIANIVNPLNNWPIILIVILIFAIANFGWEVLVFIDRQYSARQKRKEEKDEVQD